MIRLKQFYKDQLVPLLKKEMNLSNVMEVPKLTKITINMGIKDLSKNKNYIEQISKEMNALSGQKPIITRAKKSISAWKIREGFPIGVKVTLRQNSMYDFMEKLIWVVIPRILDFRGFPITSFDGQGNFNVGIKEYIAFPEIDFDQVEQMRGLDIAITTSTKKDHEAHLLLKGLRFPIIEKKG
jgi:large subunit ribosomal protein L5